MSASGRKRIEKIEDSLTPRQAVLLWLEEASQFGSMRAYVLSLQGDRSRLSRCTVCPTARSAAP
jgi:hypothetical protein